jgi:hypothetical protein
MPRLLTTTFIGLAMLVPAAAPFALFADEHVQVRTYHDKEHNDDHEWNNREDRAYRMWAKENHRKYVQFNRVPENDQQAYWGWRHNHTDAQLNINIR